MEKTAKSRIFGLVAIALAIAAVLTSHTPKREHHHLALKEESITVRSTSGATQYTVEIAKTPAEQEYGLMNRTEVPPGHGMLFIWPQDGMHDMWMKNTLIPLDMLFVDEHGKILFIASNTTPNSETVISAHQPTRAVIELAGGQAAAHGIKAGDQVIASYFVP